jgi:hypothetical protein
MSTDEHHVAQPRLYGGPAYARPRLSVTATALPLDPDDLPIAAEQTPQERQFTEQLLARPFGVARAPVATRPEPDRRRQSLGLSALAGKLLRRAS